MSSDCAGCGYHWKYCECHNMKLDVTHTVKNTDGRFQEIDMNDVIIIHAYSKCERPRYVVYFRSGGKAWVNFKDAPKDWERPFEDKDIIRRD